MENGETFWWDDLGGQGFVVISWWHPKQLLSIHKQCLLVQMIPLEISVHQKLMSILLVVFVVVTKQTIRSQWVRITDKLLNNFHYQLQRLDLIRYCKSYYYHKKPKKRSDELIQEYQFSLFTYMVNVVISSISGSLIIHTSKKKSIECQTFYFS